MVKMPTEVKVGSLVYTIEHSHEALLEYMKANGMDCYGVTQHQNHRIIVDDTYPVNGMRNTLLHEVMHVVAWVYGLENDKLGKEHCVGQLALALLGVLRDNPELVAYLTATEERQ